MRFNIRVYGILIQNQSVLVTDENRFGHTFTKFPGGGLESGEGILDCLIREFQEELNISIEKPNLFHINENFVPSAFNQNDQIISIYYLVQSTELNKIQLASKRFDFNDQEQIFRMISLTDLNSDDFRFPIDKEVIQKIKATLT